MRNITRRTALRAAVGGGLAALAVPVSSGSAMAAPPTVGWRSSNRAAVQDLQRKLGGLTVDGIFGKLTLGRVIDKQLASGLYPDGVVGPLTWAYVNDPRKGPSGTPFRATGARRIVLDKRNNSVFSVNPNGTVARWGWAVPNQSRTRTATTYVTGKIRVNRDARDNGEPGNLDLHHFVRFDGQPPNSNGFHAIPVNRNTGRPIHGENELGRGTRQVSKGCVRLSREFAEFLYGWIPVGARVTAVNSIGPNL